MECESHRKWGVEWRWTSSRSGAGVIVMVTDLLCFCQKVLWVHAMSLASVGGLIAVNIAGVLGAVRRTHARKGQV